MNPIFATPTPLLSIGRYVVAPGLLLLSAASHGDSMTVGYGRLEQQLTLANESQTLHPVGPSVALSLDFADDWLWSLDYQQLQDDQRLGNQINSEVEVDSWGTSLDYYLDNWSLTLYYSALQDDSVVSANTPTQSPKGFRSETGKTKTLGTTVGYGWDSGPWLYNLSASMGRSHWDLNTQALVPNGPNRPSILLRESSDGHATSLGASASVAYFWPLDKTGNGLMIGGLLSWQHELSGDTVQTVRNGRAVGNAGGRGVNNSGAGRNAAQATNATALQSLSGDDDYGQLLLYLSYDINAHWSVGVDGSVDLASVNNGTGWALSLGYFF